MQIVPPVPVMCETVSVWQEPVTFEDVAVYLSHAEWDAMAEEQRELYRSVMLDNYQLLTSLGYPGPKPDIVYRLERGEEPWGCAPQSPLSWDGPRSPSPGHAGDMSWLEESRSDWWPGTGGRRVSENRARSPSPRQCTQWRLRSRRLLRKFTCLSGKSESSSEATVSGMGPEGHRDQAWTGCPGKEGGAEGEQEVTANIAQSRGFPLDPVLEQQKNNMNPPVRLRGDPGGTLQGSAHRTQHSSGEVTLPQEDQEVSVGDQRETIWKDHGYCGVGEMRPLPCTLNPCPLREHDYCWNREAGALALADHGYCRATKLRYRGRVNNIAHCLGTARATFHRQKSQVGRIIRKAKEFIWFYKPWVSTRMEVPPGSSGAISGPQVSPAPATSALLMGRSGEFCAAEQEVVSRWPCGEGTSQERMSEVICTSVESSEPVAAPLTSSAAMEELREASPPETCEHPKVQGTQPVHSPDAAQNAEGHKPVHPNYMPLSDTYKVTVQTVNHAQDSVRQNRERGGHPQHKGFRSVIVQTVETFFTTAKPAGAV
ncbi:hypothetical protein AV530_010046 [Patagioenas fasciata monilis]|uniref:KRAB domain-containing protein n=1 Tax=Patagioenas fasciata monilis TaxID=372326 RepID=A0A1V4KRM6_PATFA|nr:hypothetical protein AV530_010046 [Patagioenas fasciata monilis]